jgi:hypothetical protein
MIYRVRKSLTTCLAKEVEQGAVRVDGRRGKKWNE